MGLWLHGGAQYGEGKRATAWDWVLASVSCASGPGTSPVFVSVSAPLGEAGWPEGAGAGGIPSWVGQVPVTLQVRL